MSAAAPLDRLLALIGANWTTQAIGAAVRIGLPERLAEGPRDTGALARATGCDAESLARLLRALEGLALVRRDAKGRFALTATAGPLRADAPDSARDWALWCSGDQWRMWADLDTSVRTGRSARQRAGAAPGYGHLDRDADAARVFHGAMAGLTRRVARAVAASIDWRGVRRVMDVGGGQGELLAQILGAHAHLEGVLVDLPHAMAEARRRRAKAGLGKRLRLVPGSFFDPLPEGVDCCTLKSILHNWDDGKAFAILRRCREALDAGGRILVIERVMPDKPKGGMKHLAILRSDLNMLASLGGRERTRSEFAALLAEAGFTRPRIVPTETDYAILSAAAR